MARKPISEPDFDRELADLPPELRWREWKARVEAVLFAAPKPVTRDILARVVGRDCALELLIDDLKEDFLGRPIHSSGQESVLRFTPAQLSARRCGSRSTSRPTRRSLQNSRPAC